MKILKSVREINRGGFGIIDEVTCDDGKNYARKTFSPQDTSNPDLLNKLKDRFIREVKTQKKLPRDLFIPILYEELNVDNPWFLMPVAEDVYINEINNCKHENRTPEGLSDILNSLEFLHSKTLVHRDLKPQNILKHEGVWKLADFGLITQNKDILSQTITTSNNAFGTMNYCAPEQITEFRRVTHLADIYSFGAILHDIFTNESRVPCSELTATGEIGLVIEKCTKIKKEKRFNNVNILRNKLLYILSKKSIPKSEEDNEWFIEFKNSTNTWDINKFESFVFFLKKREDLLYSFLYELNYPIIETLYSLDEELFNDLAIMYFDWIYDERFGFGYCDVIIGYIRNIYDLTKDLEVKAKAVISSAELAQSHNRWYVMREVVNMANKKISDDLAYRISIEIDSNTDRNKYNLNECVDRIHLHISSYHELIENTLIE